MTYRNSDSIRQMHLGIARGLRTDLLLLGPLILNVGFNCTIADFGKYKRILTKQTLLSIIWIFFIRSTCIANNWIAILCRFWWVSNALIYIWSRYTRSVSFWLLIWLRFSHNKINDIRRLFFHCKGINPTCSISVCSSFTIIMNFILEYLSQSF